MVTHSPILDGLVGSGLSLVSHCVYACLVSTELAFLIGISSVKMAISEIGVSFPDSTFGHESRFGIPFTVCTHNGIINLTQSLLIYSTFFETFSSLTTA